MYFVNIVNSYFVESSVSESAIQVNHLFSCPVKLFDFVAVKCFLSIGCHSSILSTKMSRSFIEQLL